MATKKKNSGKRRKRIAVICGGFSNEREVSMESGKSVTDALPRDKYRPAMIEIYEDGRWMEREDWKIKSVQVFGRAGTIERSDLQRFDAAFIAMHGKFGEDGGIQGMLDMFGIPYTGSGVLASALGMNKKRTLETVEAAGVLTPKTMLIHSLPARKKASAFAKKVGKSIGFPCVVKPNGSGSSVGITIVKKPAKLMTGLRRAFREDSEVLIQKYLDGQELTCAVMGNYPENPETLPIIEIIPPEKTFFDYDAKYTSEDTQEICPAKIPAKVARQVRSEAKKVHMALGCDGLTRSDFIYYRGRLYFLEINTVPGLTEASLVPKAAKEAGMSFGEFLDKLIELALDKE